jgi:hypothetical protein
MGTFYFTDQVYHALSNAAQAAERQHGMLAPSRKPFVFAEVVRVVGGRLIQAHDNWCRYVETGNPADCRCQPDWHLIAEQGGRR